MSKQITPGKTGYESSAKKQADTNPTDLGVMDDLYKEVHEKDILLSLNNDIASIRDKKDILKIIHPKLKELFNADDIFICRLDRVNETLSPFLRVAGKPRQNNPEYEKILNTHFPIYDGYIDSILNSKKPVVFDLNEVCQWPNPSHYIKISKASGLNESLSAPLYHGDKLTGILTIWSEKKGSFTPHHEKLIQQVADQVSIVVANISDNETLRQKEKENEILLSVSRAIPSIRDKNDLIYVIQQTLKTHLRFSDIAITKFNLAKGTFKVFLEHCEKSNLHPDFEAIAFNEYPIVDGIHDVIMRAEHTVVLSVKKLLNKGMVHIEFLDQAGIKELAGIKLQHNNEVIGTMVLLSGEDNSFSTPDQSIIEAASHHFSTAMVNILYHEEILQRNKENEILLSVSSAFSSIRDKKDLLPILKKELECLSFYNDISIAKVDETGKTFSSFLLDPESKRRKHPVSPQMVQAHHPFPDGVFDMALRSKTPVLFDLAELIKMQDVPSYVRFLYENGVTDMAGVPLHDRNIEIGVLFLFSDQKKNFTDNQLILVQGIGDQLGTAMANILANEQIIERENEKTVLLSLSNEIATVRNKDDLFKVVNDKLTELFSVKGFAISLVNEDGTTRSPFLINVEDNIRNHPSFDEVISRQYVINDGIFNTVLHSDDPVTIKVNELPETTDTPAYVQFWKKLGIELIVGTALRVGENNLGALFFYLEPASIGKLRNNLLKGVCAQISIALSNILANEKIAKQLEEISRYKEQLEEEKMYLQEEVSSGYTYSDILGNGPEMKKIFQQLSQVSFSTSTVLILGETGTGKELIARAIHNSSPRRDNLMVKVNCAVIPPTLIESELFGHEKGSFTGAEERRIGKFELANNGTLFLDEIGEMPVDLQVKLLRVLQEKEIERIGGKTTIKVDVRIIAATNRHLQKEVEEGKFRHDLFYRLNVFPISLPPLRNRKEDIPALVSHFIDKYSKNVGKDIRNISGKAMKELMAYSWPGNVRELEHLVERSVLMTTGTTIKDVYLPSNNKTEIMARLEDEYLKTHEENERDHIIRVLNKCNGKIYGPGGAASILNLRVSTLNSKIKKLGIRKNKLYT